MVRHRPASTHTHTRPSHRLFPLHTHTLHSILINIFFVCFSSSFSYVRKYYASPIYVAFVSFLVRVVSPPYESPFKYTSPVRTYFYYDNIFQKTSYTHSRLCSYTEYSDACWVLWVRCLIK